LVLAVIVRILVLTIYGLAPYIVAPNAN